MICFTIPDSQNKSNTNTYSVSGQESLAETFKHILGNYKQNVVLQLDKALTIDEANQLFSDTIEKVIATYPLLNYDNYVIKAPKLRKTSTFSMILKYPSKTQSYEKLAVDLLHQIINKTMSPQLKDYEKEWLLYNSLVRRTTYSNQIVNGIAPPMTHTVQGVIVDQVGVCDGYAKSLMYMLNAVGVPTRLVFGTAIGNASQPQPHAWNLVKIQGHYYHVDATWGDQDTQNIGSFYDYFNETDDYMARTHIWDRKNYPSAKNTDNTLINMPIKTAGIYHVGTPIHWEELLRKLKRTQIKEATLILSGPQLLAKSNAKLLEDIVQTMQASIQYNIIDKYGKKIISYRMTN